MEVTTHFDPEHRYRLLQLTPRVEQGLRDGSLTLLGNGENVYVCTKSTTHLLRRLKQSNTLVLTSNKENELQAYAAPTELLETIETPGEADWSQFPIYCGVREDLPPPKPVESTCSPDEYKELCRRKPVVEIAGQSYAVSADVVHEVLVDIVSGMVEKGDLDLVSPLEEIKLETEEPIQVVRAVYNMFAQEPLLQILDKRLIAEWTGIFILKQNPQGMALPDFYRAWIQDIPVKMNTRLDMLTEAVETRPGSVRYIDRGLLSAEPRTRFLELFRIKPSWLLTDLEPFVNDLVPPTQKLENWILKYARKTRQNKEFVITARKL